MALQGQPLGFQTTTFNQPIVRSNVSAVWIIGVALLAIVVVYFLLQTTKFSLTSAVPVITNSVNGNSGQIVNASSFPASQVSDYGMQFWMYIADWNYQFGQDKPVIQRVDPTNASIMNPSILLDSVTNSLHVKISTYDGGTGSGAAVPGASGGSYDDTFTCTVENVPIQSWFAVSLTVFQRNVDIYINGKLVKSCVLPGIPKPALGNATIGGSKGYSGSLCGLTVTPGQLVPGDAANFYAAGTPCSASEGGTLQNNPLFSLFGYTVLFQVNDASGKNIL
jgi:hypothetical protein